jgi:hypothetical protein
MSLDDCTQAQYSQSYYEYLARKERGELDIESDIQESPEKLEDDDDDTQSGESSNHEPPLKRHDPGDAAGKFSDTSSRGRARTKSNSVVRKRLNYSSSDVAKATPTAPSSRLKKSASSAPAATLSAMKHGFSNADNRLTPISRDDARKVGEQSLNEPILEILSQVKKTNERLGDVEKRLQQLEEKAHSSSVTTSGGDAPKISVPTRVRVSQIAHTATNA